MPIAADLTGQRFGKLVAIRWTGARQSGGRTWLFRCDCGGEVTNIPASVRRGDARSCGCSAFASGKIPTIRGTEGDRLYRIWKGMRERCANPNHASFHRYGGRGVSVCAEWDSFETFSIWSRANGYRDDLSIDREDNDGDYKPGNCRWATRSQQARNKANNRRFNVGGETKTLVQIAEDANVNYQTLHSRVGRGITIDVAVCSGDRARP